MAVRSLPRVPRRARSASRVSPDQIEEQRRRLFEVAALVDVIRLASCSNVGELDGDQLAVALGVVYTLVDQVAGALERGSEGS